MQKVIIFTFFVMFFVTISVQASSSSILLNEDSSIKQWVSQKYAKYIPKGIEYANKIIGQENLEELKSLDFRGLKLTNSYDETVSFALENYNNCQGSGNYHYLSKIVKAGSKDGSNPVSRSSISCKVDGLPNQSAWFDFTALGRLGTFSIPVKSEENRKEFLETLKLKFPQEIINTRCRNGNNCINEGAGWFFIQKKHLMFKANFTDRKMFDDGKYYYLYEITLQSDDRNSTYLLFKDRDGFNESLTNNKSTAERTKL